MKVIITGANGFIGRNLRMWLMERPEIEQVLFDIENDFAMISENLDADYIIHLAGVNRSEKSSEFQTGNVGLLSDIIAEIKKQGKKIPIIFTSSVHAGRDDEYGRTKLEAEKLVREYGNNSRVYRLHGVFGKWCRPNYNSVVATFCHNFANNLPVMIDDENKEIELIYIDDVIRVLISAMSGKGRPRKDSVYYVKPRYKITLGKLKKRMELFQNSTKALLVPDTGDALTGKLYAAYVSYLPQERLVIPIDAHSDDRGGFVEFVRTETAGQVAFSSSKIGVSRGSHYHHTKQERFMVVQGKAKVSFSHVLDKDNKFTIELDAEKPEIVMIPVGYTHKIENIGGIPMLLLIWASELFDPNEPDTYAKEVNE
jgi:UDP-2-acetamido-2,6-beta-L-arabino-hexul-4-ose reductase